MSNSYSLFKSGWGGVAIEGNNDNFAKLAYFFRDLKDVSLCKCFVTPLNVGMILSVFQVPHHFGFLNLDIDGYDYFILEKILESYRPALLCVEINERIPPPIRFAVKWHPDYVWNTDHFYGQSLSQLYGLCRSKNYDLVNLHYNNAFLLPREANKLKQLTAEQAYRIGYLERKDRFTEFPWNVDMEPLLTLPPEEGVRFIMKYFAAYEDKYICHI